MTRKYLDMTVTLAGRRLSVFFDGDHTADRTWHVPPKRMNDVRYVMNRKDPLAANQMVAWMEEFACRA